MVYTWPRMVAEICGLWIFANGLCDDVGFAATVARNLSNERFVFVTTWAWLTDSDIRVSLRAVASIFSAVNRPNLWLQFDTKRNANANLTWYSGQNRRHRTARDRADSTRIVSQIWHILCASVVSQTSCVRAPRFFFKVGVRTISSASRRCAN